MPKQVTLVVYEKGEMIETVHGEKLTVIRSEVRPVKRRKQFVGRDEVQILAESKDGQRCWFPESRIKQPSKNKKSK